MSLPIAHRQSVARSPAGVGMSLTAPCPSFNKQLAFKAARNARHCVCHASDAVSEPVSNSSPAKPEPVKVPLSELPKPANPQAYKALQKSTTKTGLPRMIGETLNGLSITIIGDDTLLNNAFGKALATQLGWFPTTCQAILAGMKKTSLKGEALVAEESAMLRGLRDQRRVVIATMRTGATSVPSTYRDLWGSLIVRIDEEDKYSPKPKTPERVCHASMAEVQLVIRPSKGFGKAPLNTPTEKANEHVALLLKQIATVLQEQPDLVQRKEQYMQLGYRGDWPELQPASWNPLVDGLDRKPVAVDEQA